MSRPRISRKTRADFNFHPLRSEGDRNLSVWLDRRLTELNLSMADLARLAGTSTSSVEGHARGETEKSLSAKQADKWAPHLGVLPGWQDVVRKRGGKPAEDPDGAPGRDLLTTVADEVAGLASQFQAERAAGQALQAAQAADAAELRQALTRVEAQLAEVLKRLK